MGQSAKKRYKKPCGVCGKKKWVILDEKDTGVTGPKSEFGLRKKRLADGTTALYSKYMCRTCEAIKAEAWRAEQRRRGTLKKAQRQWRKTSKAKADRTVFLPVVPLVRWLQSLSPTEQLDSKYHRKVQVSVHRVMREYRNGLVEWVSLATVDNILTAYDRADLLTRLWTEDELSGRPYWEDYMRSKDPRHSVQAS